MPNDRQPADERCRLPPWTSSRRLLATGALAALVVAASVGLRFLGYSNDLGLMLPSDPGVQRTMRFLRESNLSREIVISLALRDGAYTTRDLIQATDRLIGSIHTPLVTEVTGTLVGSDAMQDMSAFLRYTPQLLSDEAFAAMTNRLTADGVRGRCKAIYLQCLQPVSSFTVPFMRADPLGASDGLLRDFSKLFASLGYAIEITDGHFVSKDGRHSLVVLKTPVEVTDSAGSRQLVGYLQQRLKELPDGVTGSLIAGHLHSISNEDIIRRDIELTSVVATIAFLALFLLCFRDFRAVLVFVMPLVAVVFATYVAWAVCPHLSAMVVGLSTVIAGIAIDYGIYVYVAIRRAGNGRDAIRRIIRPIAFGAFTTMSVFAAFFLSHTAGYRQLALLSTLSIALCLLFALYVLPRFITGDACAGDAAAPPVVPPQPARARDRRVLLVWVASLALLALSGTRLTFNEDVTQMDGTGREIKDAEEEFHRVWGGGTTPGVVVAPGRTLEEASCLSDAIFRKVVATGGRDQISSLSAIWPSRTQRSENLRRWEAFWSSDREEQLQQLLATGGQSYGFATNAFQPFFDRLHAAAPLDDEPKGVGFYQRMKDRFVVRTADGYQVLSFFPEGDDVLARMSAVAAECPGAFVVSRRHFGRMVSHAAMSELLLLAIVGIGATVLLTVLLLRSLRLSVLALVPVMGGLAAVAGAVPALGLSLNIPSIIASLVVVSIVSDYGMFVVYNCCYRYATGTQAAVSLAAASTLIGAGALLFARHPTLFAVGVTLVTGVLAGYLTSIFVIPPLYRLWPGREMDSFQHLSPAAAACKRRPAATSGRRIDR